MQIRLGNRTIPLPASRLARTILGVVLVVFGMVGFLPILGFWMIPLGLAILSIDLPIVRRWRRRATTRLGGYLKPRYPRLWRAIAPSNGNAAGTKTTPQPEPSGERR